MASNILDYFKYSKVTSVAPESNDLFNVKKWKKEQTSQNLNIIANNLDLPEYQNFIIGNWTELFDFDLTTTILTDLTIEKLIKLNLINVEIIKTYCKNVDNKKKCEKFIQYLYNYIITKMNCVDTFNKYVELMQFIPEFILENYEKIKNMK